MIEIDIGVFAYNEEHNIKRIIEAIQKQDVFSSENYSVKVYILANGCTDNTVQIASRLIEKSQSQQHFEVIDLKVGGKSRTWNRFVHEFSRGSADQLIFCDSDIWFTKNTIFSSLSRELSSNTNLSAMSSRPIKDLTLTKDILSFKDRLIASSGDGLNNWKTSICGQLYILKSFVARHIYLPLGLPVEDGYLRAMLLTNNMTEHESPLKISGNEDIFHIYHSERTIFALINHQTRIVIGSSINFLIFNELRKKNYNFSEMIELSKQNSQNEAWLPELVSSKLPTLKYGWIPWHFLFKRINYAKINLASPKRLIMLSLGVGFDLVVYILAQYKMSRGKGVGHW